MKQINQRIRETNQLAKLTNARSQNSRSNQQKHPHTTKAGSRM